ncbi:DoxX family protein [Phytoactinopolyspora endophytica]|uniref:DoxX family protein n=1 Tax=Phytoactinopolyspora endophytica TaxID=1642495 RepID=UPI00197B9B6B|nr:DoxX family protein [Phytoactinopolyspora endophytica]
MTERPIHPRRRRILTGLCWVLATAFMMGAITKYMPGETFFGPPYSEKFAEWGYPSWFRFVVGSGEAVGAVLLLLPRRRILGVGVLSVILVGAITTHIVNQSVTSEATAAPVNLVLVSLVAWEFRPTDWREPLRLRRTAHAMCTPREQAAR